MGYYGLPIREDVDSSDPRYFDPAWSLPKEFPNPPHAGTFDLERKALNLAQVDEFDLPYDPDPPSPNGKKEKTIRERFRETVTDGREVDVELNALKEFERKYLENLIEDGIREHIDEEAKQKVEERVQEARGDLKKNTNVWVPRTFKTRKPDLSI